MLLNEFIKEHGTVQALKTIVAKQEANIAQQDRKIQEQEATITQLEKGMKTVDLASPDGAIDLPDPERLSARPQQSLRLAATSVHSRLTLEIRWLGGTRHIQRMLWGANVKRQ